MSLLLERGGPPRPLPWLMGREVLVDPARPEICVVKGVMFVGRQKFLKERFGEAELQKILARLSPKTRTYAATPLAGTWCEFKSLVEFDRAIYEELSPRFPNILALVGAASAEYGIGTVYRVLDDKELIKFLKGIAFFHEQYQKYGRVTFTPTDGGGEMAYFEYPCYSPVFCASAVGFFLEAILRHGGHDPHVEETKCHCRGDAVCLFELRWS